MTIDPQFVRVPHEPSADARRAAALQARLAVVEDRIANAGMLILDALNEQLQAGREARNWQLLNLAWDLQVALCLRTPGAPEPPVVPGRPS